MHEARNRLVFMSNSCQPPSLIEVQKVQCTKYEHSLSNVKSRKEKGEKNEVKREGEGRGKGGGGG